MIRCSAFVFFFLILGSCSVDSDEEPMPIFEPPQIFVSNSRAFETQGGSIMQFEIASPNIVELPVSFNYTVEGVTATPDVDFVAGEGSSIIGIGSRVVNVEVRILDDDIREVDETVTLTLTAVENGTISKAQGIGTIQDSDAAVSFDEKGYITNDAFFGYQISWQDEFNDGVLNLEDYNFDLGDGCPDLCTWGNGELQVYTNDEKNIVVKDGSLVLTATKSQAFDFNSARINTKDKREFQFGRIDIRAKLPFGQGIWPAIWMLGANIDDVGWPACGEIDIMEMVGHLSKRVYGTAHWGPQGRGYSTFKGGQFNLNENFSNQYHVFTIIWQPNKIDWYVDESKFFTITPEDIQGEQYRFNQSYYLLFNVAVGGEFPGNPDSTTTFPQTMEIDYVRVFQ